MDGFDVIGDLLGELVGTAAVSSNGKKGDDAAGCGCFIVAVVMIICIVGFYMTTLVKPKEEPKKVTTIEAIVTGKFQNDQLGIHIRSTGKDSLVTVSHDLYINKDVNDYIDIKSN